MADPTAPLRRWLRLRARRAFVVVGALPSEDAAAFAAELRAGHVLPIPVDAASPEEADVVVIVGRVSTRSAASVAQLRTRASRALIVAFDSPHQPIYATAPAASVVDTDIVVDGIPPSPAALEAVCDAVLTHPRATEAP